MGRSSHFTSGSDGPMGFRVPVYPRPRSHSNSQVRAGLRGDGHIGARRHELEKLHDVLVAHAYAPDRSGFSHLYRIRTTVDVDVAPHGVHLPQPVFPRLATRQPQDAREYPVAAGKALGQLRRPDLPGRAAPHKHGVDGMTCADFRAHDVLAPRGAETPLLLARTVTRSRDRVSPKLPPVLEEREALLRDRDFNSRHGAARRRIPRAAAPPRPRESRRSPWCGG